MMYSRKFIGSIRFYMMVLFILAAIVVLLLFILYLYIMSPNVPNAYASSSSNDSRLTIIETGTVPSNARFRSWEYTIYSIDLGEGLPTEYYIEYYCNQNRDVEIEQIQYR